MSVKPGAPSPRSTLADLRRQVESAEVAEAAALLSGLHPAERAWLLLRLTPRRRRAVLASLSAADIAEALDFLSRDEANVLAAGISGEKLADVLDQAEAEVAAGILRRLPPGAQSGILEGMERAPAITPLLHYHPESAGGLMVPVALALRADVRARDAISYLRRARPNSEAIYHLYVVDEQRRLIGMLTLPDLVLADPWRIVRDLMSRNPVHATAGADREDVARLLQRYDLVALPVVDEERRLVGVITADEVADVVGEEATEDMYRMVGLTEEEKVFSPFWFSVRRRLPWLCVNLATAFLAASVVAAFEASIAAVAALAIFLPVMASQGSNAGAQTLTVLIRGLALGEIRLQDTWRAILKEVGLGLVNGLAIGLVTGIIAAAWMGDPILGVVVGVAMVLDMVVAGFGGVAVPLFLRALRVDPALASVIFVTTVTDVFGFLVYLGLASLWLPGILNR